MKSTIIEDYDLVLLVNQRLFDILPTWNESDIHIRQAEQFIKAPHGMCVRYLQLMINLLKYSNPDADWQTVAELASDLERDGELLRLVSAAVTANDTIMESFSRQINTASTWYSLTMGNHDDTEELNYLVSEIDAVYNMGIALLTISDVLQRVRDEPDDKLLESFMVLFRPLHDKLINNEHQIVPKAS